MPLSYSPSWTDLLMNVLVISRPQLYSAVTHYHLSFIWPDENLETSLYFQ